MGPVTYQSQSLGETRKVRGRSGVAEGYTTRHHQAPGRGYETTREEMGIAASTARRRSAVQRREMVPSEEGHNSEEGSTPQLVAHSMSVIVLCNHLARWMVAVCMGWISQPLNCGSVVGTACSTSRQPRRWECRCIDSLEIAALSFLSRRCWGLLLGLTGRKAKGCGIEPWVLGMAIALGPSYFMKRDIRP